MDKYFFVEQADVNPLNNEWKVIYERALGDKDGIEATAGYTNRRVDEEAKSEQWLTNATWRHKWSDRHSTGLEYSFSLTEFALPNDLKIPEVLDPDSTTHGLGIKHTYMLRTENKRGGAKLGVTFGYDFLTTDADGADQDVQRHRVSFTLKGSPFPPINDDESQEGGLLHKLQMEAKYVHDFDDYRNETSTAGTGFQFNRSANIDRVQVTLTLPIDRELKWESVVKDTGRPRGPLQAFWTLGYAYTRTDSNIFGEDKDNHVIKAGIIADF